MKSLSMLRAILGIIIALTWSLSTSADAFASQEYFNEDTSSADAYLRLSNMRCENCTLIVQDLIEAGAVSNTLGAVKRTLEEDANYAFRLNLLTACNHCYRAAHYWEMNVLNRLAKNEEIQRWLTTEESRSLVEYFSR